MKTQSSLELFQYWNRLRYGAPAPCRTQIEPSDIRDVLSQTFILEAQRHDNNMAFRVVGTSISSLFGRQLRQTFLRDLFNEAQRPLVSRLTRNCYQDSAIVLLSLDSTSRTGRKTTFELMILPLQDEKDGHRVLGCLAPEIKQFWHGLDPIVQTDLQSIRIVDPDREPLFLGNRPEVKLTPLLAPSEEHLTLANVTRPNDRLRLMVIQGGKIANDKRP